MRVYKVLSILIFLFFLICCVLLFIGLDGSPRVLLPGYVKGHPLFVGGTKASDVGIIGVLPPYIEKTWWDDRFIVTLNHPLDHPNQLDETIDYSESFFYAIDSREDAVYRFEDESGLRKWVERVGIDFEKVQLIDLFTAQKMREKELGFKFSISSVLEYTEKQQFNWWKSNPSKPVHRRTITAFKNQNNFPEIDMVYIEPGDLRVIDPAKRKMGSYLDGQYGSYTLSIEKGFSIGKYEITQAQFASVMGYNPSSGYGVGDNYPVYNVTYDEAVEFCERLTEFEHSTGKIAKNQRYTLPTGDQWEYACRAGAKGDLCNGNLDNLYQDIMMNEVGWYWYNQGAEKYGCHSIGEKKHNNWGLYDMHGNVSEWCQDGNTAIFALCSDHNVDSYLESNPLRFTCGGSWYHSAYACCSGGRLVRDRTEYSFTLGFRVTLR